MECMLHIQAKNTAIENIIEKQKMELIGQNNWNIILLILFGFCYC